MKKRRLSLGSFCTNWVRSGFIIFTSLPVFEYKQTFETADHKQLIRKKKKADKDNHWLSVHYSAYFFLCSTCNEIVKQHNTFLALSWTSNGQHTKEGDYLQWVKETFCKSFGRHVNKQLQVELNCLCLSCCSCRSKWGCRTRMWMMKRRWAMWLSVRNLSQRPQAAAAGVHCDSGCDVLDQCTRQVIIHMWCSGSQQSFNLNRSL